MNKRWLLPLLFALLPFGAHADTLGFVVGAGSWGQSASGTLAAPPVASTTFTNGASSTFMWAAIEHPIPLIPNFKYVQLPVTASNAAGDSLTLNQTDIILYYELLDNWINVDFGLNIKTIDGSITTVAPAASQPFSAPIPMGYLKGAVEIPATNVTVGAEISTLSGFTDMNYFLSYESSVGVGVELGQRTQTIAINTSSVTSDLTLGGTYMAVFYHF
jgi:outer membrane protein